MLKIAISGSHGFVGSALAEYLKHRGHQVESLARPYNINGADIVIHLAGENLFKRRWTKRQKERIYTSRIETTRELVKSMQSDPPKAFFCASAVGLYGDRGEDALDETEPAGHSFLSQVCADWEAEALLANTRVVNMRFGVVLDPSGGALHEWLKLFHRGVGAPLGTGEQWLSWIALQDLCHAVELLIHNDFSGPINMVSPEPIRNIDLSRALAEETHHLLLPAIPRWLLKTLAGEIADGLLLSSTKCLPRELSNYNFNFTTPSVSSLFVGVK